MRLNHNLAALNIYREHVKTLREQSSAIQKISSGEKISSSKDDSNGIAQSERLRIQIRGLQVAQQNTQDGISMLQTVDGGLDNVTSLVQRIRELAVQAGGVTTNSDKTIIQGEITQLISGINDTVKNTEFNGVKLIGDNTVLDNSNPKILKMTSGANVGESINIPVYNLTADKIGDSASGKYLDAIDVTKVGGVDEAISIIDGALSTVISVRSKYGAIENRFEGAYNMISDVGMSDSKAESDIRDADIANEMMNYTKSNLLMEAGNAMMVQANKFPQDVLKILENVR